MVVMKIKKQDIFKHIFLKTCIFNDDLNPIETPYFFTFHRFCFLAICWFLFVFSPADLAPYGIVKTYGIELDRYIYIYKDII